MDYLAESTNSVASSIPDIGTIEMPAVEIPDTSAYTGAIQSAMDTAPIMAEESWGAAKETATSGLEEIGTSANDTYGAMAAQAESAWDRMKTAAASAVSATITELQKLKNAIKMMNGVSSISIMRPKKTGLELAEEDKAKGRVTQWNSVDEMFDTVLGE